MKTRESRLAVLLWAYPKSYRETRGDEILGTLADSPPPSNRLEMVRVVFDVVAYGVRRRLGIASDQGGGRVLAAAALAGLTMAAAAGMAMAFFAQVLPGVRHDPVSFGPDTAIWPSICVLWILAAAAALAFPRRTRLFAGACVIASVATSLLAPRFGQSFLPALPLLVALSVPALLAPRTPPRQAHRALALLAGAAALCPLVAVAALSPSGASGGPYFYVALGISPFVVGSAALTSTVLLAARKWVQGAALLLLTVPWLVFAYIDRNLIAAVPSFYAVWIEIACAVGVGSVGTWIANVKSTYDAPIDPASSVRS